MGDKRIKVTDKRMFTPEGDLRQEYQHLEGEPEAAAGSADSSPDSADPKAEPASTKPPEVDPAAAGGEIPATFYDLVGLLAQPIALYLGDATLADGESAENLDLARLYIDLLEILRQKCKGNLAPQELTFLDDLLYQLRLRYVQKRG